MPTPAQITAHAKAWVDVANAFKSAYVLGTEIKAYNGVNDPGWSALDHATNPDLVTEAGLIVGTEATPDDIANAIGSVVAILEYMAGVGTPSVNAWKDNLEKLCKPIV
jgi:hypothetical protein